MSHITQTGQLSDAPELRYAGDGKPVCTFTVGENTAGRGKEAEWTNVYCVAFGDLAENVATSLAKGDRVIVQGRLKSEEYEKRDGSKGKGLRLYADDVAPSLRWANCEVERNPKK